MNAMGDDIILFDKTMNIPVCINVGRSASRLPSWEIDVCINV